MCIYDASWRSQYGFCCDIDEESSRELAREFSISFPSFFSHHVCLYILFLSVTLRGCDHSYTSIYQPSASCCQTLTFLKVAHLCSKLELL